MFVKESFDKFGKYLVTESRKNLTRKGKRSTSNLYKSLDYETKESKNSFEFSFLMEDYGDFVDKGVKGKVSSFKAPTSPFKFGTGTGRKGGLTQGINQWVKRENIQFRNKKGQFITRKSTAFLIIRSIYNTGLKTTNFFTRPFNLGFKRLPEEIRDAYALEIEDLIEFSRK